MDAFIKAWQTSIVPLRIRMGFRIESAWVVENENKFIWILAYDGADWDAATAAYFASPERKSLNPDPAQHIAHIEEKFIMPVLFVDAEQKQ